MKNPDLTPLNGLDVGLKAHNSDYFAALPMVAWAPAS